ncbi:phage tail terminator family protein [Paenibacillus sanguinis]|uniref:phage tail terminator family protein n=1 Tax=Paenibacillus sanguinis TaxID=225906 RepID=UPI000475CC48|nr:hypothetical protein [Paenibacillus sanguinis]
MEPGGESKCQARWKAGEEFILTQMTLNDVVQSLAHVLTTGIPEIPVHTEKQPGDAEGPYLFVQLAKSEQSRELHRRYKRTHSLEVHFVPGGANSRVSTYEMAERLYELLADFGTGDGLMSGAALAAQWQEDGRLLVQLTFTQIVWSQASEEIKMGTLRQEGELKNGV